MTIKKYLNELGLSENQQMIFISLASNPESTVVMIAKDTELPRSTIYLELDRLKSQGYVISKKVSKTTKFSITDPRNIKLLLNDEKGRIDTLFGNIDTFIEQIEKSAESSNSYSTINLYHKQEGIKQLLWNTLRMKEKHIFGYSPGKFEDIVDHKFGEQMRAEYKKLGITNRVILNESVSLDWSEVPNYLRDFTQARTLEEKKIRFEHEILMYDDTMIVISKKDNKDQYGIEITDPLLVGSHKQLFEFIWNEVAKEIPYKIKMK
jgi:sugar-specific transcriptional regulator TrmB